MFGWMLLFLILSLSYIRAAKGSKAVAGKAEKVKIDHYEEHATRNNAMFFPLSFETFGAIGVVSQSLFQVLSTMAEADGMDPEAIIHVIGKMKSELQVLLQRGNTRIIKMHRARLARLVSGSVARAGG